MTDSEKMRQLEAQIKDLQKQVAEREEEKAILKEAAHYFSKLKKEDAQS
jgi:transposase-like protein